MPIILNDRFTGISEPEVKTYIDAVEQADGQLIEFAVANAINDFVRGCKNDGIWDAIKASCILAGARTLDGALVPLRGAAPTSFNFVSGDYDRKTGLIGNGSNKYLDSNRANNADPQNSKHISMFTSTGGGTVVMGGRSGNNINAYMDSFGVGFRPKVNDDGVSAVTTTILANTFIGASRNSSTQFQARYNNTNITFSRPSSTPQSETTLVYARRNATTGSPEVAGQAGRYAFYSIGESLNLALLDTRVTTLMNTFSSVIP